jgi:hypothetical protein
MVNLIVPSDGVVGESPPVGLEDGVLDGEQNFVGKLDGVFLGHCDEDERVKSWEMMG